MGGGWGKEGEEEKRKREEALVGGCGGQALLETCIEVSYTPTRSPRQIDANFIFFFSKKREESPRSMILERSLIERALGPGSGAAGPRASTRS